MLLFFTLGEKLYKWIPQISNPIINDLLRSGYLALTSVPMEHKL